MGARCWSSRTSPRNPASTWWGICCIGSRTATTSVRSRSIDDSCRRIFESPMRDFSAAASVTTTWHASSPVPIPRVHESLRPPSAPLRERASPRLPGARRHLSRLWTERRSLRLRLSGGFRDRRAETHPLVEGPRPGSASLLSALFLRGDPSIQAEHREARGDSSLPRRRRGRDLHRSEAGFRRSPVSKPEIRRRGLRARAGVELGRSASAGAGPRLDVGPPLGRLSLGDSDRSRVLRAPLVGRGLLLSPAGPWPRGARLARVRCRGRGVPDRRRARAQALAGPCLDDFGPPPSRRDAPPRALPCLAQEEDWLLFRGAPGAMGRSHRLRRDGGACLRTLPSRLLLPRRENALQVRVPYLDPG